MPDPLTIGFVGAPGSGKTVLAAQLYASLLEQGCNSAGYVPEQAKAWIGAYGDIKTLREQVTISSSQYDAEEDALGCRFNPLVCDSAIWMGGVYARHHYATDPGLQDYFNSYANPLNRLYTYTIFTPLFSTESKLDTHRIHDYDQSKVLEVDMYSVATELSHKGKTKLLIAPKNLSDRPAFVKQVTETVFKTLYNTP